MTPHLTIHVEDDDSVGSHETLPVADISDNELCLVLPGDEPPVTRSLFEDLRHRRQSGLGLLVAKLSRAIRAVLGRRR